MGNEQNPLEERLQRIRESKRQQSEEVRAHARQDIPAGLLPALLESSPLPVILYRDHRIAYVNPATLARLGYTFDEIKTFDDMTLDTGARKERLDNILKPCGELGWNDLDLELIIPTLDKKELRMEPHMRREVVDGHEYWIAHVMRVQKIDPQTLKGKALSWIQKLQRVFQRKISYLRAPEYVGKDFVVDAIKHLALTNQNTVIDFKKTKGIAEDVLPFLEHFNISDKEHLYLVNVSKELYHLFRRHAVPEGSMYRTREVQYA